MTANPFNPSAANPRYLAGRETEKAALADVLETGAQSPVAVIYAPRGNGKTALAHWVERTAASGGIDVRYRYARSCQTASGVAALLLNTALPNGEDEHPALEAAAASYGGTPRLLVVDEAQGLPPTILSALLTTTELSKGALSVLLVGTPLLHQLLHDVDPSLWAKCPVVALDPLDAESATDALQIPATEAGRPIDRGILKKIVKDASGYPPFLQAWGANLWRLSAPEEPIGAAAYEQAKPIVDFYRSPSTRTAKRNSRPMQGPPWKWRTSSRRPPLPASKPSLMRSAAACRRTLPSRTLPMASASSATWACSGASRGRWASIGRPFPA